MTLLLTKPFTDDAEARDDAGRWAVLHERLMRESAYRDAVGLDFDTNPAPGVLQIPARDAGDVCHVCGEIVTWTDHLPALNVGGAPRCFADVRAATGLNVVQVRRLAPGERREGDAIVYSAAYIDTSGPEAV